ncbi:unnamed protein product, partial [Nesidiocoris tenuis]
MSYADDTCITVKGKTWCDTKRSAENVLSVVMQHLKANRLVLNIKKTNYICFSNSK